MSSHAVDARCSIDRLLSCVLNITVLGSNEPAIKTLLLHYKHQSHVEKTQELRFSKAAQDKRDDLSSCFDKSYFLDRTMDLVEMRTWHVKSID